MQEISNRDPSEDIFWQDRQIQRKYAEHAADFGVTGSYIPQNAERFKQALKDFVDQPGVLKIQGTYRGQPVIFYTDPSYSRMVLIGSGGQFVSGWKLNTDQSSNLKGRHSL